jgi:hypothetical protein
MSETPPAMVGVFFASLSPSTASSTKVTKSSIETASQPVPSINTSTGPFLLRGRRACRAVFILTRCHGRSISVARCDTCDFLVTAEAPDTSRICGMMPSHSTLWDERHQGLGTPQRRRGGASSS